MHEDKRNIRVKVSNRRDENRIYSKRKGTTGGRKKKARERKK
jgi:hypothetical protein